MSLILHNPKGLMPWRDFDRIFDRFFAAPWPETNGVTAWSPAVDIEETDKEIILTADLPDVDEKDLDVRVEDDVLTLKAERKFEKESKKENFHRLEAGLWFLPAKLRSSRRRERRQDRGEV